MKRRWTRVALASSLPLAIFSQVVLTYYQDVAWLGGVGYLAALVLFVGGLACSYGRALLIRRATRPAWGFLAAVVAVALVVMAGYLAHVQPLAERNYRYAILLWVAGVGLFVVTSLRPGAVRRRILRIQRREVIQVGLLFAVALVLRVVGLSRFPNVMSGDEAAFAMEAQRILTGVPLNPFGTGWYVNTSGFFYLQAVSLRLLGWNLFALRLPSALLGALGVVAVYLLARGVFGRETAWVGALFMAGWSFTLHFSRLGFSNCADPFFGALMLAFLQRGLTWGRRIDFVVAGLALGASLYFYIGLRLAVVVVLAALFFSGAERLRWRSRGLLVFAVIALLVSGPLLAHFIRQPDVFLERQASVGLAQSGQLANELQVTGMPLWQLLLGHLGVTASVFMYTRDLGWFYRAAIPMLYILSGALFVLGLGLALVRGREVRYKVPIIWVGLTVVFAGWLLKLPPHYDRYLIAAPAVALLVGRGGVIALRQAARLWGWRPVVRRGLVLLLAVALLLINVGYYLGVYVPSGAFHWDRNTETADRTARLMATLGPDYVTYFFGTTYMPLNAFRASVSFLAPGAQWVDVLESPPADWNFVREEQGALFVVLPQRESDLPLLRERFPGGEETQVVGQTGEVLFTTYRVDPTDM